MKPVTPDRFRDRAAALMRECEGDALLRDALMFQHMKECLVSNGFGDGIAIMDAAANRHALEIERDLRRKRDGA